MSHTHIPIHEEDEIEIRVERDEFIDVVEGDENPRNVTQAYVQRFMIQLL